MKAFKCGFLQCVIMPFLIAGLVQTLSANEKSYKTIAHKLSKAAIQNGIKNIAISKFSNNGFGENAETNYISDKLTQYLIKRGTINIMERAQMNRILEEIKSSSERNNNYNATDKIAKISAVDAIITGNIYKDFSSTKIMAKLIDIKTGKILAATEVEIKNQMETFPKIPEMNIQLPEIAVPADFRDAPNDFDVDNCAISRKELKKMQNSTIEIKAIYWALKLKNPGFSYSQLKQNPGSEISDEKLKKDFYKRLEYWHNQTHIPKLSNIESANLKYIFKKEQTIRDNCGL